MTACIWRRANLLLAQAVRLIEEIDDPNVPLLCFAELALPLLQNGDHRYIKLELMIDYFSRLWVCTRCLKLEPSQVCDP